MGKSDAIGVIEAAYDVTGEDSAWLTRVGERVYAQLGRGQGLVVSSNPTGNAISWRGGTMLRTKDSRR